MKLVIVGNGLPLKYLGCQINEFDCVIRLSGFKIKGFEHIVGTKTDIVSVARIHNYDPLPGIIWAGNPMGFNDIPKKAIRDAYPNGIMTNPYYQNTYQICGYDKKQSNPTLGMHTIVWAAEANSFFEKPISLVGFNFGHIGCQNYYWSTEKTRITEKHRHDGDNERKVLKNLINEGYVKYLDPEEIILLEPKIHPHTNPLENIK